MGTCCTYVGIHMDKSARCKLANSCTHGAAACGGKLGCQKVHACAREIAVDLWNFDLKLRGASVSLWLRGAGYQCQSLCRATLGAKASNYLQEERHQRELLGNVVSSSRPCDGHERDMVAERCTDDLSPQRTVADMHFSPAWPCMALQQCGFCYRSPSGSDETMVSHVD